MPVEPPETDPLVFTETDNLVFTELRPGRTLLLCLTSIVSWRAQCEPSVLASDLLSKRKFVIMKPW
jgi:hypothetical protein